MIKKVLRRFAAVFRSKTDANPPVSMWSGNYLTWQEASNTATGYNAENILVQCKNALLKVRDGKAIYERDSVIFDKIQYSYGVLAGFLKCAVENKLELDLIDFGGSLGSTYFQNKAYLSGLNYLSWSIIEQEHFVSCGKENFENNELKFYLSIEECITLNQPKIIFLSGVLQYLEKPFEWLGKFIALNLDYILIDRTAFIDGTTRITLQNVSEDIYIASYPSWFFNEQDFLSTISQKYILISEFPSYAEKDAILEDGIRIYWKGFLFKRK